MIGTQRLNAIFFAKITIFLIFYYVETQCLRLGYSFEPHAMGLYNYSSQNCANISCSSYSHDAM